MRIGDKSSYGRRHGGHHPNQRAQAFRRRFHVGQTLVGRFLRWERAGLAWIGIADLELLAGIEGNPVPGTRLVFRVLQLEPDIILKELPQKPGSALTLKHEAIFFFQLRDALETRLDRLGPGSQLWGGSTLIARRSRFFKLVRTIPEVRALLRDMKLALKHINVGLLAEHHAQLHYAPWHAPGVLRHECLIQQISPGREVEVIEFGHIPGCGAVQMHLVFSGDSPTVRLELEHPDSADTVRQHLVDHHLPGFAIDPQSIPVSALPAGRARGNLANRVALAPHPTLRLNLKV
ncbi:hypothetical protein [Desulfovibrio inopinatus]|uniref:hypothetical protein n=1 Tax=Desulfovibrio inopinatus TaxID=102109 RepID=UPI00041D5AA4|nr:hypothetical protein [Desulfovibrio inopinatus]